MNVYAFQPISFLFHWTLFIGSADAIVAEITSTLSRNSLDNARPDSQLTKNLPSYFCFILFYKRLLNDTGKDRHTHESFFQAQNTNVQLSLTSPKRQRYPATHGTSLSSWAKQFSLYQQLCLTFLEPASCLWWEATFHHRSNIFFTAFRVFQKEVWC